MAALRGRAAALAQEIEAHRQAVEQLRETEQRVNQILDATNELFVFASDGVLVEASERFAEAFGYETHELIGKKLMDIVAPESREKVRAAIMSGATEHYEAGGIRKDGARLALEVSARSIVYHGRPTRVAAIQDITERRRAEEEARAATVQREVIRAQEAMLVELSTPILPISDEIIVLPLIGAVNAERAAQVVRVLVEGVAKHRARTAILDITGVPDASDHVADALLHAARAAELLGARVILTGIRPEVAQRFILLGTDLTGIVTHGTLESGVAHALAGC